MNLTEPIVLWFLVFARAGALLTASPVFSQSGVPVQVRVALSAMVAFLVVPVVPATPVGDVALWTLVRLLFIEISVGLFLGFIGRLAFFAVEMAANAISTEIGLMMSTQLNPLSNTASPVTSLLLHWMSVVLLLTLDLHHWILAAFQRTYEQVPPGGSFLGADLLPDVISRTGFIFTLGLQIAAPVIAVSLVVSMVFSMVGRAVPQMNIFSESMPVRALVGLGVFGFSCTLMAQYIVNYLRRIPGDLLSVARLMGS